MKIGVIGCGAVTQYCHLPALLRIPDVTIVAVADPDESLRNRAARTTRSTAFNSAQFLLASSDVEAVIIATPPHSHADIGVMAARAGKAIYVEKPIAIDIRDAMKLAQATSEAGVRAAVGFNRRNHPLYVRARSLVQAGKIGVVRAVQTIFCEPIPVNGMPAWKEKRATGGGVLLDLASHHIDAVRWLLDTDVASVDASLRSDLSEHDSASVTMSLDNDAVTQSFYSFRAGYAERITLIGDGGTLELDRHRGSIRIERPRRFGYGSRRGFLMPSASDISWKARKLVRPAHDPSYHRALKAFSQKSALPSLEDGELSLRAVLAAEESALSGRPVDVSRG